MGRFKGILFAFALFLTGALVGALGREAWRLTRGGPPGGMGRVSPADFILERMSADLKLSPEQRAAVRPLIERMLARQEEARRPCREADAAVFGEYQDLIRKNLTPEQAARHDELLARLKARTKDGFPPGPPPGPPPFWSSLFGPPPHSPPQSGTAPSGPAAPQGQKAGPQGGASGPN